MEDWEEGAAETLERLTGSPMADALQGTIRIVGLSEPKGRSRYQACEMDLILEGPGLDSEPLTTEVILDRRYWPTVGMVLRARISLRQPRMIDVNWDALAREKRGASAPLSPSAGAAPVRARRRRRGSAR